MTPLELKSNFHKLIDNIDNDDVLSKFYELLSKARNPKGGVLWARLSKEEREELLQIEKESRDDKNLIPHSEIIKKHKKWL